MACANSIIAIARETQLFVGLEATCGVQLPPTDAGMNLCLTYTAGQVSQTIRQIDDPQYRNTRSMLLPITASFDAGKFTFPLLLKAVAGAGAPAEPEIDPFLQALFGQAAGTDATWFGATAHRSYKLVGTNAGGTSYPTMTIWFKVGHLCYYATGATCNQGEFDIVGNDLSKVTFSGEFMRMGWMGSAEVAGSGTGTSLTLAAGTGNRFFTAAAADKLYVGSMDTAGVVTGPYTVNSISGDVLTLNASATWGATDVIVPYLPAGTEAGTPLYGKYGKLRLGTYATKTFAALPAGTQVIQSSKLSVTNGIRYHADLKDDTQYPTEFVAPGARQVQGEISMFMYRNTPSFNSKAQADPLVPDYVIIPTQDKGNTAGRRIELHIPNATWGTPNAGGEDEKSVSIPFKATATAAYNDEFALVYIGG